MNRNRILSGLLAMAYMMDAGISGGGASACRAGMFVALPLSCVWFSDLMGRCVRHFERTDDTGTSPAQMIFILGWVLLLLPVLMFLVSMLAG